MPHRTIRVPAGPRGLRKRTADERAPPGPRRPDPPRRGVRVTTGAVLRIPCTQCGGPLPVTDDVPFVRCAHCTATLFLDLGRYVLHGAVRARLGRRDVESALVRHLETVEA